MVEAVEWIATDPQEIPMDTIIGPTHAYGNNTKQ